MKRSIFYSINAYNKQEADTIYSLSRLYWHRFTGEEYARHYVKDAASISQLPSYSNKKINY